MAENKFATVRAIFDSLMAGGIILLAFYVGIFAQRVEQLEQKTARFEDRIIFERLVCLESHVTACGQVEHYLSPDHRSIYATD